MKIGKVNIGQLPLALGALAVSVLAIFGALVRTHTLKWGDLGGNLLAELIGAAVTVGVLDRVIKNHTEATRHQQVLRVSKHYLKLHLSTLAQGLTELDEYLAETNSLAGCDRTLSDIADKGKDLTTAVEKLTPFIEPYALVALDSVAQHASGFALMLGHGDGMIQEVWFSSAAIHDALIRLSSYPGIDAVPDVYIKKFRAAIDGLKERLPKDGWALNWHIENLTIGIMPPKPIIKKPPA